MSFLVVGLFYLSYGLMFWGATLVGGGPGDTGAWPLMYTLLGLGPKPRQVSAGAKRSTGGFAEPAGGPEQRFTAGGGSGGELNP